MYAIIESGSKQYNVSVGDRLEVELIKPKEIDNNIVRFDKVLFISGENGTLIGTPYIKEASVICDFVVNRRGKKTISFKYRRRHASSKKKIGHRQNYTVLKVKEIKVE